MFGCCTNSRVFVPLFSVFVFVALISSVSAQDSLLVSYQGLLTDDDGNPITGTPSMVFTIFDEGGTSKWTETHPSVQANDGYFTVILGSQSMLPDSVFNGEDRYLGIAVGGDPEMSPRKQFSMVPDAYHAYVADSSATDGDWVIDGNEVYHLGGNVGIGTSTPSEPLVVGKDIVTYGGDWIVIGDDTPGQTTGLVIGDDINSHSRLGWSVNGNRLTLGTKEAGTDYFNTLHLKQGNIGIGVSNPTEPLVVGKDVTSYPGNWIAVGDDTPGEYAGLIVGEEADNHGWIGWTVNTNGLDLGTREEGVDYWNTLVVKQGNIGINCTNPSENLVVGDDLGSFGGNRITIGDMDAGVNTGLNIGKDTNNRSWITWNTTNNDGLRIGTKENGTIYGNTVAIKSGNVGIGDIPDSNKVLHVERSYDLSMPGSYGIGIYSNVEEISPSNAGLVIAGEFRATGNDVFGLYVEADGGSNTAGSFNGNDGTGISASGDFRAGSFNGDVNITGTLSKSGGSFKIDHPLDLANKYLQHSFVESPDMMNIYNGNIILDGNGEATVEMPDWFDSLNKDFRYQLTCIGGFGPVYISEKMNNGKFSIAGGTPGLEVSWQVTGIRQDPWANEHRIEVEVDKPEAEKGYYIAPELYGYGEEQRIAHKLHGSRKSIGNSE